MRSLMILAALLPQVALAQEVTPQSFEAQWVAVEFEGQTLDAAYDSPATLVTSFSDIGGQTPCDTGWSGRVSFDWPKMKIEDVQSYYDDSCPAYKDTIAFLDALEKVDRVEAKPEGIELQSAEGKRLILLNAGG